MPRTTTNAAQRAGPCRETLMELKDPNGPGRATITVDPARMRDPIPEGTRLIAEYPEMPTIICICGSTRFMAEMAALRSRETLAGHIVVGPEVVTTEQDGTALDPALKRGLDALHRRKIDLADEVVFANVDNYWGKSTFAEYKYAIRLGKTIRLLERGGAPP